MSTAPTPTPPPGQGSTWKTLETTGITFLAAILGVCVMKGWLTRETEDSIVHAATIIIGGVIAVWPIVAQLKGRHAAK
jgi:hypothetical protein